MVSLQERHNTTENIIRNAVTHCGADRGARKMLNSTQASFFSNSTDGFSDPAWWDTFELINGGTLGILVLLAIVGNTLTIAAVVKFRHLRERHYMMITSLAVADALVGVAWGIFLATMLYPVWCSIALDLMLITFPSAVSHMHILVLAIDRFIAIKFPFRYMAWMSERYIKISIAVVWTVPFVYILTFLPWALRATPNKSCSEDGQLSTYVVSTQFVIYLLVVCAVVMIYSHINRVAKQQVNKVNVTNATTAADAEQTCTSSGTTQNNARDSQGMKLPVTPNMPKATKFMIAVIVAYLVTWTPYFLVALSGIIKPGLISTNVVWDVMIRISIYFMLLNSCLNIFIYAVYITGFRKAYKSILTCSCK